MELDHDSMNFTIELNKYDTGRVTRVTLPKLGIKLLKSASSPYLLDWDNNSFS